jgi:anti-sigma factor RsiW
MGTDPEQAEQEKMQAFVDGELDRQAMADFAAKVGASPALARDVARLRADKLLLKTVYGPLADQPIPDRLRDPFRRHRARHRSRQVGMGVALAAGLALAAWFGPGLLSGDLVVKEALAARRGSASVTRQVALSEPERDSAVSTALAVPLKVPDLERWGYRLAEITLYGRAAQISYRDAAGRLFTLYLRASLGADRFDLHQDGQTEICVWQNAELAVAMVGEMSAKEMLKLASSSYADLNL